MKTTNQNHQLVKTMISFRSLPVLAAAFILNSQIAQAHPGHAMQESEWSHLLTSPFHLAVLASMGAALAIGAGFIKRTMPRRALQWGGAAMLVAAAVIRTMAS